jgi:enoyl-CoA hydratase/carnithine racemase
MTTKSKQPQAYETIRVEHRDGVDWLSLNRPAALNTVDQKMLGELHHYLDALPERNDVRIVVLRGEGRLFCAGLDLNDQTAIRCTARCRASRSRGSGLSGRSGRRGIDERGARRRLHRSWRERLIG